MCYDSDDGYKCVCPLSSTTIVEEDKMKCHSCTDSNCALCHNGLGNCE